MKVRQVRADQRACLRGRVLASVVFGESIGGRRACWLALCAECQLPSPISNQCFSQMDESTQCAAAQSFFVAACMRLL